jgi:hypothetical protein
MMAIEGTMTQPPHPTTPLAPGYYWEHTAGLGWRQVRPMNWFWLAQYQAKQAKKLDSPAAGA